MKRNTRLKLMAKHSFGNACQRCGYDRCMDALHFHHLDSSEKYDWAKSGQTSPREVMAHPERFQLLCANCHYEVHADEWKASKKYEPCQNCGQLMAVEPRRLADGRDKFCSRKCKSDYRGKAAQTTEAIVKRFWKLVNKTESCWLWTGCLTSGYACLSVRQDSGKRTLRVAARLSYEIHIGPIPAKSYIEQSCNNKLCVNPDHLVVSRRRVKPPANGPTR